MRTPRGKSVNGRLNDEQIKSLGINPGEIPKTWPRLLVTTYGSNRAQRAFRHYCKLHGIVILGIVETRGATGNNAERIVWDTVGAPVALEKLQYESFCLLSEIPLNVSIPNYVKSRSHFISKTMPNGVVTSKEISGRYHRPKGKQKQMEETHVSDYKRQFPDGNPIRYTWDTGFDIGEPHQSYVNKAYAQLGACDAKREQENIGQAHESQFVAFQLNREPIEMPIEYGAAKCGFTVLGNPNYVNHFEI